MSKESRLLHTYRHYIIESVRVLLLLVEGRKSLANSVCPFVCNVVIDEFSLVGNSNIYGSTKTTCIVFVQLVIEVKMKYKTNIWAM